MRDWDNILSHRVFDDDLPGEADPTREAHHV